MAAPYIRQLDEQISRFLLARCHNIADLRRLARWRVPAPMFHYMDGAADDEVTMGRNQSAFDDLELLPRNLIDISRIDTSTTVLGQRIEFPLVLAPTGMSRLFHWEGELAVARAAARAGTIYSLSTVGTHSVEEVAAVNPGPKWFQIYVFKDRGLVTEFIDRCRAQQYHALCLTIDLPLTGNRERDLRTGMTVPPKLSVKSWLDFALRPLWSFAHITSDPFTLANVAHRVPAARPGDVNTLQAYIGEQFDRTVTWDDAALMVQQWNGPFAVKGILTVDDAKRAVDIGATCIIVSNHGGRQLDGAVSSIKALPGIVDAAGKDIEVWMDGGIRSGQDVLKAWALGAKGTMIGRSFLYGLGAMGGPGVTKCLEIIHRELDLTMAFTGHRDIQDVTKDILYPGTY